MFATSNELDMLSIRIRIFIIFLFLFFIFLFFLECAEVVIYIMHDIGYIH